MNRKIICLMLLLVIMFTAFTPFVKADDVTLYASDGRTRVVPPEDVEKWKNEVEPLVGKTNLYAYPYGEWAIGENCTDLRAKTLLNAGFSLFFGVGASPYYLKMPLPSEQKLLFQDRCAMDGVSLRAGNCNRFFNSAEIYDHSRPIPYA